MADITIREVTSPRDLYEFIVFPNRLYKNEKYYVPYLISERKKFFDRAQNPFFLHSEARYFLASRNGKTVGRIAGIINNNHNKFHEDKTGFFGFLDCEDNPQTASALLDTAIDYVKAAGMNIIRGPMNFSTNDEIGFLVDGFDQYPMIMMPYNPPYYTSLCENIGLKKAEDVNALYIDDAKPPAERIQQLVQKMRQRQNIKIRSINMDDFENELELVRFIYNSAWSKNWGFVPMTPEEFQHMADDFKKIIEPRMVFLAFVNDEPAGFSLALPDYNVIFKTMNGRLFPIGALKFFYYTKMKRIIHSARIITLGIVHKYHNLGLDMMLFLETFNVGSGLGYHWGELSWILERNMLMNKAATQMGAKLYKTYRIYEKAI